jgi:hypothetical protein
MSHTLNIKTEIRDINALTAACTRLNIPMTIGGTHKLFESTEEGTAVHLEGWLYPAVIKTDGSVAYDTYNGLWGKDQKLHELTAYYGLEKAKIEARKKGYSVYEARHEQTRKLELRIRVP